MSTAAGFAASIFDMDGLLIDSEILWHEAEIEILGALGVPLAAEGCRGTKGMFVGEVTAYWFERHNRYSTLEALASVALRGEPLGSLALFSLDPIARRRALKRLLYRVPLRPAIIFLYLYVVRLGLLDGRAGYYFSRMRAAYELFIDVKVLETRRRQRGLTV